ncbi:hypothetical protein [Sphingobium sp.]|uniref:hypothetical protein n=1 Tax=Sphingobium sp. TaxID=1912891 RepID=UPI002C4FF2AD|nr:hypothetical protein [Sphingobium sp.]HUD90000.1 hypothetical protein [Sphingobium sp.]
MVNAGFAAVTIDGDRRETMPNQSDQDKNQRRDQQGGAGQRDRQQQQENKQGQMGDERRQDKAPGNKQQR